MKNTSAISETARGVVRAVWLVLMVMVATLAAGNDTISVAVIGDYGSEGQALADVSQLIHSWNPDIIITLGDNNYPDGEASTIDQNIGQYFHDFISPYQGSYGAGADTNRFFPSLGNHDWRTDNAQPYLDYFTLPGNERYYDFVWGPVHFFALDSDPHEPDGNTADSPQATWLKERLARSTAPWRVVYFHHAPYSSAAHGNYAPMQWPFKQWGASVVMAGHDHTYERLVVDSLLYFVNGLGGRSIYGFSSNPLPESQFRYNADYGAMLVTANRDSMVFQFYNRQGELIDRAVLTNPTVTAVQAPSAPPLIQEVQLLPAYPNPFNGEVVIPIRVRQSLKAVEILITDIRGRVVMRWKNMTLSAGRHAFRWQGTDHAGNPVASGVYFVRLRSGSRAMSQKLLLIR